MASRGRDLDPGIRITFLGGTDDSDDGASDVCNRHVLQTNLDGRGG
jgi:hypothetical protein